MATPGAELPGARVTHVGVVVPDIDATLRQYARAMGFHPGQVMTYPIPMPDGRKAEFKLATLRMPNFHIELIRPLNTVGPYDDHLQSHGMSIQHVGVAVPDAGSVDDLRRARGEKGRRWTLGAKGDAFAYPSFEPDARRDVRAGERRTT
jgi:catechol 2,3-dioxygenase-like lactoylglutathione lyase family enzyme